MPIIRIPSPLRRYTNGETEINLTGATIAAALADLTSKHPEIEPHLFIEGELRSFVNIYLNKEDIRYLQGVATAVAPADQLIIIPSIAGGRR